MTTQSIEALLRAVFERARGPQSGEDIRNFIFHMRDWEEDLQRLAAIYRDPDKYSEQECKAAVDGFLLHACGHIMQAARLYGGIIDAFGKTE